METARALTTAPPGRAAPSLVSVVVPVRNHRRWLGQQLDALARQTYAGPCEVVVVDNGSTDGGMDVARAFAGRLPSLRIVDASDRRGINHARNAGARAARGDLLVFCDADDVVADGWVDALVRAARSADVVGGRLAWDRLNDPLACAWRPAPRPQGLGATHGFLPYAPGGNLAVWTRVARELGWDERFRYASSDQEFGWRAQLAGYRLGFAPDAVVHQRFRAGLGAMAWQQFVHGVSGAKVVRAFRDRAMPPPDNRAALLRWRWLAAHAPDLLRSPELRGQWIRRAAFRLGRLTGSVAYRTLCL